MTLLELMVVITILALMAGLVVPRIGPWLDNWRVRSAAERIAQAFRYARTRALFEQHYYLVEIFPEKSLVRVLQPDSKFMREFSLPDGVQAGEGDPKEIRRGAPEVLRYFFPPSGEVEQKDLWLRNKQGRVVRIHMGFLLRRPGVGIAEQGS
jgi:type II secretory pathway pseudopilin PulG